MSDEPMTQDPSQSPATPEAAEEHASDYAQGARKTAITEVQPIENDQAGLAPDRRSGFASAEGREGPASEGGGH